MSGILYKSRPKSAISACESSYRKAAGWYVTRNQHLSSFSQYTPPLSWPNDLSPYLWLRIIHEQTMAPQPTMRRRFGMLRSSALRRDQQASMSSLSGAFFTQHSRLVANVFSRPQPQTLSVEFMRRPLEPVNGCLVFRHSSCPGAIPSKQTLASLSPDPRTPL